MCHEPKGETHGELVINGMSIGTCPAFSEFVVDGSDFVLIKNGRHTRR